MNQDITAEDLKSLMAQHSTLILLDTRLSEDYQRSHLPNAKNACVFVVDFLNVTSKIIPDKSIPVCVYGAAENSLESKVAANKLVRAGFETVYDFRGGITAWIEAGFSIQDSKPPLLSTNSIIDGKHDIDLKESHVEWLGRNLINKHWGTVALKEGYLEWNIGQITGGEFIIDMTSITCKDIEHDQTNQLLIDHLKSDDFFDTSIYPESKFKITSVEQIEGAKAGSLNVKFIGQLTIKGTRAPIAFAASVGVTSDGQVAAQATTSFDRTFWDVLYGSGKYFQHLAGHLVNDQIEIQMRILTVKTYS